MESENRSSWRLADLAAVIVTLVILYGLLFPGLQRAHDPSRRMQCVNKLKQFGIGVHNYHDTYITALPAGCFHYASFDPAEDPPTVYGSRRVSGFVALLPFIEMSSYYNRLMEQGLHFNMNQDASDSQEPGVGLGPLKEGVRWDPFNCPSDRKGWEKQENEQQRTSYRFCFGDFPPHSGGFEIYNAGPKLHYSVYDRDVPEAEGKIDRGLEAGKIDAVNRGMFGMNCWNAFADVTDGISNTVMFTEHAVAVDVRDVRQGLVVDPAAIRNAYSFPAPNESGPKDDARHCFDLRDKKRRYPNGQYPPNTELLDWPGRRLADGAVVYSGFVTVLPPNSPSCIAAADNAQPARAILSASSHHKGGVNVVFGDCAVKFISNDIDWTTDLETHRPHGDASFRLNGPSKFGVWGALGSRSGGDSVAMP